MRALFPHPRRRGRAERDNKITTHVQTDTDRQNRKEERTGARGQNIEWRGSRKERKKEERKPNNNNKKKQSSSGGKGRHHHLLDCCVRPFFFFISLRFPPGVFSPSLPPMHKNPSPNPHLTSLTLSPVPCARPFFSLRAITSSSFSSHVFFSLFFGPLHARSLAFPSSILFVCLFIVMCLSLSCVRGPFLREGPPRWCNVMYFVNLI